MAFKRSLIAVILLTGPCFARGRNPEVNTSISPENVPAYGITGSSTTTNTVSMPDARRSTGAAVHGMWRTVPNTAFQSNEDYYFAIKWGIITAGYSNLSVMGIENVGGRPAFHLVSTAHSAGVVNTFYQVYDRNDAWVDTGSLTTVSYQKHIREGHYQIDETVDIDQVNHRFKDHSYRIDKKKFEDKEGVLPPYVLDVLGSLFYVRTLPMVVGQSYSIDVYSGEKVYPLTVDVRRREKVNVPAGKFDCFVVEPLLREPGIFVTKGKKLQVWLTADENRMPVMMRSEVFIGHVSAELLSYHNPRTGTHSGK